MLTKRIIEKSLQIQEIDEDTMIDVAKLLTEEEDPATALTELRRMVFKSTVPGMGGLGNQLVLAHAALIAKAPLSCQEKLIAESAKMLAVINRIKPPEAKQEA